MFQIYVTFLSVLSCNTSVSNSPLDQAEFIKLSPVFSTQNDHLLHILEDLQSELPVHSNPGLSEESRIRGYFYFDTIFKDVV